MGVPKFYRWLSERYSSINQVVTDSALLPEFDHLYLDMNGIIHGCTHPNHMDISDVLSERDMMLGIMNYLDRIITQIVKPKVSVYMAIDGVAPRAKLNQQRSRRFRSAKDMAEATKDMAQTESKAVFDSNCITPGTEFMARVSDAIKYFIRKKIKEDPLWRNLKVIFSGHEVPGEGEHKIMQHIRDLRNRPGYLPNTRHCMYGQDADLIMLGLVSHEPHFTLLREIIHFGFSGESSKNTLKTVMKFTKESDFQLLHLSVLREYLQIEFCQGLDVDLESTIDDFVFMTFLVGNDFLPHLNSLDIGDGAFDLLFETYKSQRAKWGQGNYLTHAGEIPDPARLEAFLAVIGVLEGEILEQKEQDEALYMKKRRKWDKRDGKAEGPSDAELQALEVEKEEHYLTMIEDMMKTHSLEGHFVDKKKPMPMPGEKDYKGRYYFEKLHLTPVNISEHMALRKAYIEGLLWCLAYYYRGCISWGWYYPYHYGPMLSDLINLPEMFKKIKFEIGQPLYPFEQLMGCLPPASADLVPRPYRRLMCEPTSPIIKFYPEDFKVDMNGKRNPWEGVNLLPFIDVKLLKDSIANLCPDKLLTADERSRNSIGKVLLYTYDLTAKDTIPSVNTKIGLQDILECHSRLNVLEEPDRSGISFKPELVFGTQIPYPGFPSLNVLPIESTELLFVGLNCFGTASKYPTMVLKLHKMPQLPPVAQLADNILGKSVYINWPMMHEARCVALSDVTGEIRTVKKKKVVKNFTEKEADQWQSESEMMVQKYLAGAGSPGSGGVQIGDIQVRLKLLPLQGMKTNPANGSTKKVFGQEEAEVPLQLCLVKAPAPDPRFEERGPLTVKDRFAVNSNVILTKGKYRGCQGTVIAVADENKVGVKVKIVQPEPPFGLAIARSVQESYVSSSDAAKILKLNPGVFGKITGSLKVDPGRYDLGLNLKYAEGLYVVGYTRQKQSSDGNNRKRNEAAGKAKAWSAGDSLLVVGSARPMVGGGNDSNDREERIQWEYSPKAIKLISMYQRKFPQLFSSLAKQVREKKHTATDLFGANGERWLPMIREWLNNVETAKLPRSPLTTEALPKEAVLAVQRAADVRTAMRRKGGSLEDSLVKIPGSALYREGSTGATDVLLASDINNDEAPELGDRVVNLCANGIPFGLRGTVVSIHEATSGCIEVVMDEEFIGGANLQGTCSNFRGKLCVWNHFLKISPANSKTLVDQLIPKGSGKAAVDTIISSIEQEAKTQAEVKANPSEDKTDRATRSAWETEASISSKDREEAIFDKPLTPSRGKTSKSVSPARSSSRPHSTGRGGRQGAWREAQGPDEHGTGFKVRKGKSGLSRWKLLKTESTNGSAAPGEQKPSAPAATTASGLKALLGVSSPNRQPAASTSDASAGLKAMLGMAAPSQVPQVPIDEFPPPPPPPNLFPQPRPPHPTAADKLLQLMASKQSNGHAMGVPSASPGFNFTYVEEGQATPQAPPPPLSQRMGMPYGSGMMTPMAPHPMSPYSAYGMPPGGMPHHMMMPMPARAVPSEVRPSGPSEAEFPPLGGAVGKGTDMAMEKRPTPKKETKASALIVPSVVASKARK